MHAHLRACVHARLLVGVLAQYMRTYAGWVGWGISARGQSRSALGLRGGHISYGNILVMAYIVMAYIAN